MEILDRIQGVYPSFSIKEQRIADHILQEAGRLKNINIGVLADTVGVSSGTITRFCKKIGCDRFADLKIQLSATGVRPALFDHAGITAVHEFYKSVIERSNQLMDREGLVRLVEYIKAAETIYVYGVGSSGLTATELMLRLLRMGFNVQSITDSHLMLIKSSIIAPKDLVIAFSLSGETTEVVSAASAAKRRGATVVSLTSFRESSLSLVSDYTFVITNATFMDKKRFINNQFSAMYVIDLLSAIFLEDDAYSEKMQITVDTIIKQSHLK